jgi:hypothetical protein
VIDMECSFTLVIEADAAGLLGGEHAAKPESRRLRRR